MDAMRIASGVAAATHTAMLNGSASTAPTISAETVMEVFQASGMKKGAALGPDAVTYKVMALPGAEIAVAVADIPNEW